MIRNKRAKLGEQSEEVVVPETIQARFISDSGEEAGPPLDLPTSVNLLQLSRICNAILQNVRTKIHVRKCFQHQI